MNESRSVETLAESRAARWLPYVLVAALVIVWAASSTVVETKARRALTSAHQHLTLGDFSSFDRDVSLALDQSHDKIGTYNFVLDMLQRSGTPQPVQADVRSLRIVREMIERSDKGTLDRRLTSPELRQLLQECSVIASRLGRNQDSLWAAERYYKQWPDDPIAANNLGYFLADSNTDLDRALKLIQSAHRRFPNEAVITDSLGWVYYRLGRNREAVVELQKAVKGAPSTGEVRLHLAEAYLASGRNAEARVELKKALACDDAGATRARARMLLSQR